MNERGPLLEADGIGRRRPDGTDWLFREVSLTLRPGERLALVGPSGSGKTLLLRSLALLDPLDAGAIHWQGQPVRRETIPSYRERVIYLHQRPALFEGSVEDNLRLPFGLAIHRGRAFDRGRLLDLLAGLGRDAAFLDRSAQDLSGGEAQIVALLRAIQLDPEVLLLDEPTAALDPDSARAVEQLVSQWRKSPSEGRAYIWVSHAEGQAERIADRAVRMEAGRLGARGPR